MEIQLTDGQKAFVRQAIESGGTAARKMLCRKPSLWKERERVRAEILVDVAEASLARGEGRASTEQSMRDLADEVKQRCRARLANETATPAW